MNSDPKRRKFEADLTSNDPYTILGLEPTSPARMIKRAYFSLVREYPPEEQPEEFKIIRAAYEQLRDPTKRAKVNLFRVQEPDSWQPRKRQRKLHLGLRVEDVYQFAFAENGVFTDDHQVDFRPINL